MLFGTVGAIAAGSETVEMNNLWTGERGCGEESADHAVTIFGAVAAGEQGV